MNYKLLLVLSLLASVA
jgi:carboxypeptidase C (cathepsin A)